MRSRCRAHVLAGSGAGSLVFFVAALSLHACGHISLQHVGRGVMLDMTLEIDMALQRSALVVVNDGPDVFPGFLEKLRL